MTLYTELGNTLNVKNKMIREAAVCLNDLNNLNAMLSILSYLPALLAPPQPFKLTKNHRITHPTTKYSWFLE